jgi:hypothetical protein
LCIKLHCAVQVVYRQVAPYLFWFHGLRAVIKFKGIVADNVSKNTRNTSIALVGDKVLNANQRS